MSLASIAFGVINQKNNQFIYSSNLNPVLIRLIRNSANISKNLRKPFIYGFNNTQRKLQ